jgi:hypothetical protein
MPKPDAEKLRRILYNLLPVRPLLLISLLLVACTPQATATPAPLPSAQVNLSESTLVPVVDLATYRDAEAGLELDYPAGWTVAGGETQSRGSYVQIASWDPGPGGISSIPEGGSVLGIAIYLWDPTGDLDARVKMRRANFVDSGNQILAEEELLVNGERTVRFHLLSTDGSETIIYLLALGDRYLELSGLGDLPTLDAAMRSLRIGAASQ